MLGTDLHSCLLYSLLKCTCTNFLRTTSISLTLPGINSSTEEYLYFVWEALRLCNYTSLSTCFCEHTATTPNFQQHLPHFSWAQSAAWMVLACRGADSERVLSNWALCVYHHAISAVLKHSRPNCHVTHPDLEAPFLDLWAFLTLWVIAFLFPFVHDFLHNFKRVLKVKDPPDFPAVHQSLV